LRGERCDSFVTTLTEQEFRVKSDEALQQTQRALLPLADAEGFEVELQNGVLDVVFEEPREAKFVVSPNAPVRQIWISAMAKSYKLAWDGQAFSLNGEALPALVGRLAREFLGS
jgi:iron donor protein CyaY